MTNTYLGKPVEISRIDKVKNVIRNSYTDAMCGLFFKTYRRSKKMPGRS